MNKSQNIPPVTVRPATISDVAAIVAIYNEGIRSRASTFETRERTADEIAAWFKPSPHPILIAEIADNVVGWIAASTYRPRECYAGVVEFSVYVSYQSHGRGIGSALMTALIPACTQAGFWKLLSRIFSENKASLSLCRKHGFREVGIYQKHAQLEGVWRDVVIVERLLGF